MPIKKHGIIPQIVAVLMRSRLQTGRLRENENRRPGPMALSHASPKPRSVLRKITGADRGALLQQPVHRENTVEL
jgi:hypothetical protein